MKTPSIVNALDQFSAEMLRAGRDAKYVKQVRRCVTAAAKDRWKQPSDMTVPTIRAYLESEAVKPVTINVKRHMLSSFAKFCVGNGWLLTNPTLAILSARSTEKVNRRAFTKEELAALLGTFTPMSGQYPIKDRRHIYAFLANTGLRRAEAAMLTWGMISKAAPFTLSLPAANTKSGIDECIPLNDGAMDALKGIERGADDDRVFSAIPTVATLRDDLKRAGIDPNGLVMHSFRHYFCSALSAAGVPQEHARRLARHASIATTSRFYTHTEASALAASTNSASVLMPSVDTLSPAPASAESR